MRMLALLVLCGMVGGGTARAEEEKPGRFRIVEGSRTGGTPTLLLDTTTGETWVLCGLPKDLRWCALERGQRSPERAVIAHQIHQRAEDTAAEEEQERHDRVTAVPQPGRK